MRRFWKKESLIAGLLILLALCGVTSLGYAETDVTSKVQIIQSRLMFDIATNTSYLNVSVKNISQDVLLTPIKIVITNINPTSITVANATGQTESGSAFISLSTDSFPDGQLDPGDAVSAVKIAFNNSKRLRFTFGAKILALLPTPGATIERAAEALENKNKTDFLINLTESERRYFERKFKIYPEGAFEYMAEFLKNATLVEETEKHRKYESRITLPDGEVVTTEFSMVFENGAWRLAEL